MVHERSLSGETGMRQYAVVRFKFLIKHLARVLLSRLPKSTCSEPFPLIQRSSLKLTKVTEGAPEMGQFNSTPRHHRSLRPRSLPQLSGIFGLTWICSPRLSMGWSNLPPGLGSRSMEPLIAAVRSMWVITHRSALPTQVER